MLRTNFLSKNIIFLIVILGLFVAVRLPGLNLPYHQDEYKLADIVRDQSLILGGLAGQPPLTEGLYRLGSFLVGADNLRLWALFFGLLSAVLLWLVVRNRSNNITGLVAVLIYTFCFYGVWASLMVDTDGAILPTFFLLAVYIYDRFNGSVTKFKWLWLGLLALVLVGGFLIKLSFILVVGTIFLDFLWAKRSFITLPKIVAAALVGAGVCVSSVVLIFLARKFYPQFDIQAMVNHAWSFVNFSQRNYLQILIQTIKAVMYLSPLLIVPIFFTSKLVINKLRIFFIYLGLGFTFYFICFDFSFGALDKYLMFLIIPLVAISAFILTEIFSQGRLNGKELGWGLFIGLVASLILGWTNFLPQNITPLYPKTAWFAQIISGHLNVLTPFTGGSGPVGFYVSFLFIGLSFGIIGIMAFLGWWKKSLRRPILVSILVIILGYNLVFMEELFWGKINGSVSLVLNESLSYINSHPEVRQVITAGDIGAYELKAWHKYAGRFYPVPAYEENHRKLFSNYEGYFLVVDIPKMNPDGFHGQFFSQCKSVFESRSKNVKSNIYLCPKIKNKI